MIDPAAIAARLEDVLWDPTIPELPSHERGKVRENYDLPDGRRIIIATDRLSAFDRIITAVPLKGQVLTEIARFWFEQTRDLCPNHVLEYPDPNVLVCQRLRIMPVEIVVRGYMAGTTATSIWTMYKEGRRELYGIRFPDGLHQNERLPQPVITPTTKGRGDVHDEPLAAADILGRGLLTEAQWGQVSRFALALFARGQEIARERGLILADTKYEFGFEPEGGIVLADEIHTPDSSRYWLAGSYGERFARGEPPESLDKDFVRSWVRARVDPYREPIPEIPRAVILEAARRYVEVCETMTGEPFRLPPEGPVLDRIRANLARFF